MGDSDGFGAPSARRAPAQRPFDLTTELGRDLDAVDWAASPVGPWEQWPASLTNTVRLMTGSRFAMWMAWGEQLTFFCNDDYRRETLGAKYPWALGRPAQQVWSEIWPDIAPRIESVVTTGVATWDEGLQLFLERSGYVEETYHTFSYSPVTDDDGRVAGMLCVVSEDTGRVIGERRIALLRDLGGALSGAATQIDVATAAAQQLAGDPFDLPFALGYLYDGDGAARLHWTAGIGWRPPRRATATAPGRAASVERRPVRRRARHRGPRPVHPARPAHRRLVRAAAARPSRCPCAGSASASRTAISSSASTVTASSTTTTAVSSSWWPASSPARSPGPGRSRRNGSAASNWPSSTAPRPPSSPMSATSCARR